MTEDHHRRNMQIPRTAFPLAFYYFLFQMQMKPRTREHAIMTNSFYLQLEFCFDFLGERNPRRGFQARIDLSLLLKLSHFVLEEAFTASVHTKILLLGHQSHCGRAESQTWLWHWKVIVSPGY